MSKRLLYHDQSDHSAKQSYTCIIILSCRTLCTRLLLILHRFRPDENGENKRAHELVTFVLSVRFVCLFLFLFVFYFFNTLDHCTFPHVFQNARLRNIILVFKLYPGERLFVYHHNNIHTHTFAPCYHHRDDRPVPFDGQKRVLFVKTTNFPNGKRPHPPSCFPRPSSR